MDTSSDKRFEKFLPLGLRYLTPENTHDLCEKIMCILFSGGQNPWIVRDLQEEAPFMSVPFLKGIRTDVWDTFSWVLHALLRLQRLTLYRQFLLSSSGCSSTFLYRVSLLDQRVFLSSPENPSAHFG